MTIGICILFFERLAQTVECVQSLADAGAPIYVFNNGSAPASVDAFRRAVAPYPHLRVIDSPVNLGVSGGRNRLIAETREPWLYFLDSDIVSATPDWLPRMLRHIETHADVEVLVPRLFNQHENAYNDFDEIYFEGNTLLHRPVSHEAMTNLFPGGASCIRRSLFERLGTYDENMFVGFEDFDLAIRALRAGTPVRAKGITDISLVHDHRKANSTDDRRAGLVRYDPRRIHHSYSVLVEKHDLVYPSNWASWIAEQNRLIGGELNAAT